ncbi:D-alanyl-D-alanine carboxypeptidase [Polymorphobacter arshaanensis]|uniref:D-alanyl-D-alanine carboxypeptidase n=1 Tax=Glacieibacterium arshaanense TaxID=2511025 RepID=A0A4Y9EMC8_9SPHN|nr:D-alanyl-D-alanine carboxypeptidase family protein [Polymorphobacter arshaanensis]TFU02900.1 D-alanyl-D-alanine carboxypeptidase [Polymorphobacter arshaanensis]
MLIAATVLTAAATPVAAKSLYAEPKYAAILLDAKSGEVLYSRQADAPRYPASITKVLTLYIAFEELSKGRMQMSDKIVMSRFATTQAPSKLGLKQGATITVEDAMNVIATKSANDIAVALAEHISGSEIAFASRMTSTARRLGMKSSTFVNATGLPDDRQLTTARDIATLSRAVLRDYPQYYPIFSQESVEYKGQEIESHNHLLGVLPGVDGIKTGYTAAAGFTLAASAKRNNQRLIAVVLGGPSRLARDNNITDLIDTGFYVMDRRAHGERITVAMNLAEPEDLSDGALETLVEQGSGDDSIHVNALPPVQAPPPLLARQQPKKSRGD